MYKVQSVLIDKSLFTLKEAIDFLKYNNLVHSKVDETDRYFRFRQVDPEDLSSHGYNKIITKQVSKGIKFIIYYNEVKASGFLDSVKAIGHSLGKSHPASKYGVNPFDFGYKIGEKLGKELYKATHHGHYGKK